MKKLFLILGLACLSNMVLALNEPEDWGVGLTWRKGRIAFDTQDSHVSDLIPLFYYKREEFQINGSEYSVRLWDITSNWRLSFAGEYRFFDIPESEQNTNRGGGLDYGLELSHNFGKYQTKAQLLFDRSWRAYIDLEAKRSFDWKRFHFEPFAFFRYKSSRFNNHYFGRGVADIGDGFELGTGIDLTYQLMSHFHLLASARVKVSEKSRFVNHNIREEVRFGVVFKKKYNQSSRKSKLKSKPYLRLSYAWASPSDLNDIVSGHTRFDQAGNKLMAISYGLPVSDHFLGTRAKAYIAPMFKYHLKSNVQDDFNEYGLSFKVYIPVNIWKAKLRIGMGEGVTYTDDISFIEATELAQNGFRPSKYLNYLDLSIDFNLGSITTIKSLDRYWLGAIIHHRSGIFENSSVFGRIKGGSNYNGLYLLGEF